MALSKSETTGMPLARRAAVLIATVAAAAWIGGCDADRAGSPKRAAAHAPKAPDIANRAAQSSGPGAPATAGDAEAAIVPEDRTPLQTIEVLRAWRSRGEFSKIEDFCLPDQRAAVIAQLRAVDRLVAAGRALQNRVREHMGLAASQTFAPYSQLENISGVFSTDVELLAEHIDVDRADVTFQVAGRIPTESVSMVRRGDRWMIVADPISGVPEELLRLTSLLQRMTDLVTGDKGITADELRHEIAVRQSPILRRLNALISADSAKTASADAPK